MLLLDISDSESSGSKPDPVKTSVSKPVLLSVPGAQSHLSMKSSSRYLVNNGVTYIELEGSAR